MSTTPDKDKTGSGRGGYSYMQLLSEWELVNRDTSWMEFARCKGADASLFFAEPTVGRHKKQTEAIKYCSNCVVYKNCMKFAIDNRISHGVWGGLTPTQRRRYWVNGVAHDGE